MAIEGTCHCGAVRITIPHRPAYINACNCTVCTKLGWRCCYFAPDEVAIAGSGGLDVYVRADIVEPALKVLRCRTCGCATHWVALAPLSPPRMGINVALFEPGLFEGVEVRAVDGRSWDL